METSDRPVDLEDLVNMFDGADGDQHVLEVRLSDLRRWHAYKHAQIADIIKLGQLVGKLKLSLEEMNKILIDGGLS